MHKIILMFLFLAVAAPSVWGDPDEEQPPDPMLDSGQFSYGSDPNLFDLVPYADPKTSFDIGHVIFAYPESYRKVGDPAPVPLESVVPVAQVMQLVAPDKALRALVNQQLYYNHAFHLEQVELVSLKQIGYRWQVVWTLDLSPGGGSGVPFRYRALVSDRGKVIPPDLYIYDAYSLSDWRERLCSNLQLNVKPRPEQKKLTQQQIEKRGRMALEKFLSTVKVAPGKKPVRFEFLNCRSLALPMSVGADGEVKSLTVWGVNFKEVREADAEQTEELFTVWVSEYGAVSELKFFSREW
ncbi:hypothetical protein Pan153_09520 [Gimesia panareensis]|uniref:Uncharacterized protein n=1 Tax=Gimesia panareensis TaxID=2527978 RepID=A0A518FIZ3_9PLAN|nr:hypothetical protein [Gimesia panareensis]QDV16325.1 hypothetical protein Pan153_09520 [Gimesia panareensis]